MSTGTARLTDVATGLSASRSASFTVNQAMLIGARGGPSNALSNFTAADAAIGPLKCTKLFYSTTLPATFAGSVESTYPAGVLPVVCYKTMDTNVAAYVRSVTHPIWLVYHQEPEGDYALGSTFVSEFTSQSGLIRAQANPLVKVVYCAAGYPYRNAGTADVLAGNYIVPASLTDYYAKDVYQDNAARWPSQGLANYDEWLNWLALVQGKGKPLAVTEYGVGASGGNAVRNARIQLDAAYLEGLPGVAMWQYWWVNDGTTATNYQFTDAATEATWQSIANGTF